jgi:hypothetical protein
MKAWKLQCHWTYALLSIRVSCVRYRSLYAFWKQTGPIRDLALSKPPLLLFLELCNLLKSCRGRVVPHRAQARYTDDMTQPRSSSTYI